MDSDLMSCEPLQIVGVKDTFAKAGNNVAQQTALIKAELEQLYAYAASDPAVSTSLTAGSVETAASAVYEAVNSAMNELDSVTWLIINYSNGNW